jgi:ABC-type polysaccharide/polyol phosphate transport system ATPase subunit
MELLGRLRGSRPGLTTEEPFYALRDVSMEVLRGETVALAGLNGSGKTTLLRIIAKISEPTSGKVEINGDYVSLIGLGAGFIPTLSGRKNIYLNAAMHGVKMRRIEGIIDRIIEFSELGDFIDLPTNRYSSGMLARLGFSIAIHILPELVLIDEVLAVGDAAFQQKCIERIKEVFSGERTLLLVSHSEAMIQDLCQRTIWINGGRIIQDGPTDQVLPAYIEFIRQKRED